VKLYRTLIDGQRQVVGFANAGSVLGLESDAQHVNSCEAITAVSVRPIAARRLDSLCKTEPVLAEQILRQVARQLSAAQAQLAAVGAQSAEQKLATFLLSIADLCDETCDREFDLPMRRMDMAEFLGLRLETVSRKMSEFQRRGWIKLISLYHCRMLQRGALQSLAQGGEAFPVLLKRAS
jgi:CRP/FNR family transcriptional regulator